MTKSPIFAVLIPLISLPSVAATINFEGLTDGDAVTTQFSGLLFSNTMIAGAGISLNDFEFPPNSGSNVVFDNGGPITITFSRLAANFSAFFTYTSRLTVLAFDAANTVIASDLSDFSNNIACLAGPPCSGDVGSIPNELLQIAAPSGQISYITISGLLSGGSFVMDDVTFTDVPEPSTLQAILVGGILLLARCRRRRSRPVRIRPSASSRSSSASAIGAGVVVKPAALRVSSRVLDPPPPAASAVSSFPSESN